MHFLFVCLWLLSTKADANAFEGTEGELAKLIEVLGTFRVVRVENITVHASIRLVNPSRCRACVLHHCACVEH